MDNFKNTPTGTIIFTTVGRTNYGFDIFSVNLTTNLEHQLTDGVSVNFNGSFLDENQSVVYISERSGSPRVYLISPGSSKPEKLTSVPTSLFHDRPIVKNQRLYFVSAHEKPQQSFTSWSAVYSSAVDDEKVVRLTPYGTVDYSPSVSKTGKYVAVASYGSKPWSGEFHELKTEIVVFSESDVSKRIIVSDRGGWPSWCGDSVVYFHRQADDGWWSVYRVDLAKDFEISGESNVPVRVTPPGVHAFTPAAFHDGKRIAVATRRKDSKFRHIEIFNLESNKFSSVTESLNPNFHHYNPFVSPESEFIGYHRFRGQSGLGESRIPQIERIMSPIDELKMLRLNGSFPSVSPDGALVAFNHDFDSNGGVKIVKSDCSKRWTLLKDRTAFYNSWSPAEKNVIFTSIGPIFESANKTVQIARISFNSSDLDDREEIVPNIKILTKEETGNNAFPSCSPDGKSIVFRSGRSGHKNLYIIDAVNGEFDSGSICRLTNGPWIDTMPSWSPDGNLIAFSSNRHNPDNTETFSIYTIKPDGSDLKRIYIAGSESSSHVDRERINHVCFSKDCEWLLFTANLGGVTADPISLPNQFQPYGDLHVARVDGSGLKRLTCNGYENGTPTWHVGDDLDMSGLCLEGDVGDELTGKLMEPLWISCDI